MLTKQLDYELLQGFQVVILARDRGNPHTGNQGVHPYTCLWGQGQPSHRQPGDHSLTDIWGQGQPSHRQPGGPSLYTYMVTGTTLTQATRGSILIYMYGERGNHHTGNQGVPPEHICGDRGNLHTGSQGVHP